MIKRVAFVILFLIFSSAAAHAQCSGSGSSWSCAAGSSISQVQSALGNAGAGATFTFAPGTYVWNGGHVDLANINGVTLICATTPLTVGAATSSPCTIQNNDFPISVSQVGGVPNGATVTGEYRISGFQFQDAGSGQVIWVESGCSNYPSACTGTLSKLRVDHNTFDSPGGAIALYIGDENSYVNVYGVLDHNIVQSSTSLWGGSAGNGAILNWIGGFNPSPVSGQLGTGNNFFVENNTINFCLASGMGGMTNPGEGSMDSWGGAAIVFRYNSVCDALTTAHAVTHGGGYNNLEIYNNSMSLDSSATSAGFGDCTRCIHTQGANTNIFFNNQFTPAPGQGHSGDAISVLSYRDYAFGAGGTPRSGCCSIDEGAGGMAACDGNQSNPPDGNRPSTSTYYGYPCWHQPGRDVTGIYKPMYGWNNTWTDGTAFTNNGGFSMDNHFAGTPPPGCTPQPGGTCDYSGFHEVANRDFYEPVSSSPNSSTTSPFNGTTGMGFGPLANRPATCTTSSETAFGNGAAGVGYFATDQGSQGTLYTCSATNTWTTYYTVYTYPHPLVGGSSTGSGSTPAPAAPTNVKATVS